MWPLSTRKRGSGLQETEYRTKDKGERIYGGWHFESLKALSKTLRKVEGSTVEGAFQIWCFRGE
jgi:hypothetical protein